MSLGSRYRPGAIRRPFVNRERTLDIFHRTLTSIGGTSNQLPAPVLNVTGIGGIGKSRILEKFAYDVRGVSHPATLDLQVPSLREQENALATLRAQYGATGLEFARFDIAYAVWWQRLHPNLRISHDRLPLVEVSEVLTAILEMSGVPVFGAGSRLLDWVTRRLRRWRWIRNDPTLQELDSLPVGQLADAVTFLFADELASCRGNRGPFLLLLDSYEALVGSTERLGEVAARDAWLRDLVGQLTNGLVVVASRESLRWHEHNPEWNRRIREVPLGDLPMESRLELLTASAITDDSTRRAIARASLGVPLYLHLAIDSTDMSGEEHDSAAILSIETILERFCTHVTPEHVRIFELLSVSRFFDEKIFRGIAAKYNLPSNNIVWRAITSYSFVRRVADRRLQLHQLMVHALRRRLEKSVVIELHRLLCTLWEDSAAQVSRITDRAMALREAAYHGLQSGDLTAADLLCYADRILTQGIHGEVDGMNSDIQAYVAESMSATSELTKLIRLLSAESALLRGAAEPIARIIEKPPVDYRDEVSARLAVALAQANRILGNTSAAVDVFEAVWRVTCGPTGMTAGLWAADLRMCQGRAAEAFDIAWNLEQKCPANEHEMHGHIARLRSLNYRFGFDFLHAAEHLGQARSYYELADSVVGLANIATNEVEILAYTDSPAAISAAETAIELQRAHGAAHELGKIYTALAVAQLQMGQVGAADDALTHACRYLESAGYRSGRARAELVRAFVRTRAGELDEAVASANLAVAELEAAEVYPTFVIAAGYLLVWIGRSTSAVDAAVRRARAVLKLWDAPGDLDQRIVQVLAGLLGVDAIPPLVLYQVALTRGSGAMGFYNRNVALDVPSGKVLVRIPISEADMMDLRIWQESDVLAAVQSRVPAAPKLLYASENPRFQIHAYIEGELLDRIAPRGRRLPAHVVPDVCHFLVSLGSVPQECLPPVPADWPINGNVRGFAERLVTLTQRVHRTYHDDFADLWTRLHIPTDPLMVVEASFSDLETRAFRLVHADIHRKNIIITTGRSVFIDWELALWGDPVYELAVHLHKMSYLPDEEERLLTMWPQTIGADGNWRQDLMLYLQHERVKSTIVDSVRYAKLLTEDRLSPEAAQGLIDRLVIKLNLAYQVWQVDSTATVHSVRVAIESWSQHSLPGVHLPREPS